MLERSNKFWNQPKGLSLLLDETGLEQGDEKGQGRELAKYSKSLSLL